MEGVINFIVAILLGALIGLQREFAQQHLKVKNFAGIRTFTLISLLGSILGYFSGGNFNSPFVLLGFSFIAIISIASYIVIYKKTKNVTGTTEVTVILSYLLGVLTTTGYLELSVIFGIVIAALLTFKHKLHKVAKKIDEKELVAIIEFILVAFVVLPLLPNINYSPADIPGLSNIFYSIGVSPSTLSQLDVFNFYNIWWMVILIAGINLLGYFMVRLFGSKKGYGLAGFLGGLVSSTAVTISMSQKSKEKKVIGPLIIGTLLASSIMFVRVIFEVAIINYELLPTLILSLGSMSLLTLLISFIIYRNKSSKDSKEDKVDIKQPFTLFPAIKFGVLFAFILFLSRFAQVTFGKMGLYLASFFSGLADVDAITLSMSSLSSSGEISSLVATTSILIAVASNTLVKAGIAMFIGSKKFGWAILLSFLAILAIGLIFLI